MTDPDRPWFIEGIKSRIQRPISTSTNVPYSGSARRDREFIEESRAVGLNPFEFTAPYGALRVIERSRHRVHPYMGDYDSSEIGRVYPEGASHKKMKKEDAVMDDGPVAIPRISYGGKFRRKKFKKRMRNKLNSRILSLANQVMDTHFPLSVHVQGGDVDPSGTSQASFYWSQVNLADAVATVPPGAHNPTSMDQIIYDSTMFGVGYNTLGVYPSTSPYDYVRNGSDLLVAADGQHSWKNFIGTTGIGAWNDKEWFELKYEQANIVLTYPAMFPDFKCCVYYLLVPAQYTSTSATINGKLQLVINSSRMEQLMRQTFGSNWLDRNLPSRFNPQKYDLKILHKLYISRNQPANNISALTGPTAPFDATNYLVSASQKRIYKKWRFKYASKGMRFYVTNQASNWLTFVPANTYVTFLGGDRTTPVIPVRITKYYVAPPMPGQVAQVPFGNPYLNAQMLTQTFTWYNVQNTGNFVGPAADAPLIELP